MALVSVIIPCFNAERWLAEAIDSVLQQSYAPIEVIVIDDGSTDASCQILDSYGDRIQWESGPNRGGNHARNRGFARSKGDYIQYLDADDYLLSDKISRQVSALNKTGADVVYGDWRHQQHLADGQVVMEEVKVSGDQADVLESLLAGWWVSPACLLFSRSAVEQVGGWDEDLKAGQDRDFFSAIALSGAHIIYQPGCHSIYRRYGNVTVSTASQERYLQSHRTILEKNEQQLRDSERLTAKYQRALAQSYFILARVCLETDPVQYKQLLNKALVLNPTFKAEASERSKLYRDLQAIVGFKTLERVVYFLKRTKA